MCDFVPEIHQKGGEMSPILIATELPTSLSTVKSRGAFLREDSEIFKSRAYSVLHWAARFQDLLFAVTFFTHLSNRVGAGPLSVCASLADADQV